MTNSRGDTVNDLVEEFQWLVYRATRTELQGRFELGADEDPSDYIDNRAGNILSDIMKMTEYDEEKAELLLKGYKVSNARSHLRPC